MAKRKKAASVATAETVIEWRKRDGLNQAAFWNPLGVTQSGGSRYESDRRMPTPVALLLWARETGKLTAEDLEEGMRAIGRAIVTRRKSNEG